MRISAALIAALSAPVLLLTACTGTTSTEPVTGTVIDKEYEEAVYGTRQVPITKKTCTAKIKHKTPKTCTTVDTGRTRDDTYLKKAECYELDIRVSADEVIEVCNADAYDVLDIEDRYSSEIDYSEVKQ